MTRSEIRTLDALPEHPAPSPLDPHVLVVDGLVGRPLSLSAETLSPSIAAELTADFECREGWCVPGLHWEGVALRDLLHRAYADPSADWVQVSSDDFSTCLSRAQFETALVAMRVGGELLSHEHGGPFRLVVPGAECYTSVKWIRRIEVRATPGADTARRIALRRIGQ